MSLRISFATLFSVAIASIASPKPACGDPSGVVVAVEPQKQVVGLGEPALVTATVTNTTNREVSLLHHNAPTLDNRHSVVALTVRSESGKPAEWSDLLRPVTKVRPRIIAPGEEVTVELVMLFNRKTGFFATEPGTYWISARVVIVSDPSGEIFAPPVSIEIRDPVARDRATWTWLQEHKEEYGRLVQVPWEAELSDEFVAECRQRCDEVNSTYSEYLAHFLSRWYRDGAGRNVQEADRLAAIALERASSGRVRLLAQKALAHDRSVSPDKAP